MTDSPEETKDLGRRFAEFLSRGDVVSLDGELGAGKTQFVKGVADGFGIDGDSVVTSPTFSIVNVYEGEEVIYHVDLYRLEGSYEELEGTGFFEYLEGEGITLIEWGERAKLYLPSETIKVILFHLGEQQREVLIRVPVGRKKVIDRIISG